MPKLLNGIKGDSNPGSLDCECGILPLSHRALTLKCGLMLDFWAQQRSMRRRRPSGHESSSGIFGLLFFRTLSMTWERRQMFTSHKLGENSFGALQCLFAVHCRMSQGSVNDTDLSSKYLYNACRRGTELT